MKPSDKLFKHLSEEEERPNISLPKVKTFYPESEALQRGLSDIQERLKVKLKTGKCSNVLINQLVLHTCNRGEKFGDKIEFYNTSEIFDMIELLENNQKSGDEFNRDKLLIFKESFHFSDFYS